MTALERSQEPGNEEWLAAANWFMQETGIPIHGLPIVHAVVEAPPKWKQAVYNGYLDFVDLDDGELVIHYGTPRHSGRYPWGSGENPYQRYADFLGNYEKLKKKGMSPTEIAKSMGMTTTVYSPYSSSPEHSTGA